MLETTFDLETWIAVISGIIVPILIFLFTLLIQKIKKLISVEISEQHILPLLTKFNIDCIIRIQNKSNIELPITQIDFIIKNHSFLCSAVLEQQCHNCIEPPFLIFPIVIPVNGVISLYLMCDGIPATFRKHRIKLRLRFGKKTRHYTVKFPPR